MEEREVNQNTQPPQQTSNTIMQGNVDTSQFPTSPVLLEYALAVYFYYFGAMKARQDILSESPNANGLFPSTTSNYEIETTDYEADTEAEAAAANDLQMLMSPGDDNIAESYRQAMEEIAAEEY